MPNFDLKDLPVKPGDRVEFYFYDGTHRISSGWAQDAPRGYNDKDWKRFCDVPGNQSYEDFIKEDDAYYMGAFTYPKN